MKKTFNKLPENVKLAISCISGLIVVAIIYNPLIPLLLNYPPGSINNSFQVEVNHFYYNTQYFSMAVVVLTVIFILFLFLFKRVNKLSEIENLEDSVRLQKTIKTCFNYPLLIFLVTLILPAILLVVLWLVLRQELSLVIKLSFIFSSMLTLMALFAYSITKAFFQKILNKIGIKDSTYGIRVNVRTTLMLQFYSLLLFTVLFSFLILYSQITQEKGESLFDYYKQAIESSDLSKANSVDDAYNLLGGIEFKSGSDSVFILNDDGTVYKSKDELSEFFIKYIFEYENTYDGHAYDYYAVPTQGAFIRYNIDGSEYILGIKYSVFSNDVISSVVPLYILLFVINAIFTYYVARTLRNNIKVVSTNLSNISKNSETYINHRLSVVSNDEIGDLTIAFNKIQEMNKNNIEQIRSSQDLIVEKERLASLGQMIGGIAHNLKTPIMSIAGAAEALSDLANEYHDSVGNQEVTTEDHYEIAKDMHEWIEKTRTHLAYMSDVITAIKGQAVAFSNQATDVFTLEDILRQVDILMKHELNNALITLNTYIVIPPTTTIKGNINSLVQVINNIISNAIQAYEGKQNENIDLSIHGEDGKIIIEIRDYAGGLPENVKEKIFKEMVTTKGKGGTGLGLFMSYSNIRAHFNGKITFETKEGEGTAFSIEIPQ